jgi:hypothetical protein
MIYYSSEQLELARQLCDPGSAVTLSARRGTCDAPLSVTAVPPISVTCTFPRGEIAVVQVYGALDEVQALHVVEQHAFPRSNYSVALGDPTQGHASPFYQWVCNESDRQQAQEEDQKRSAHSLQNEVEGHQPTDEGALNDRDHQ